MKSIHRTMIGVLVMLAIMPMFAGLLACMPVPIGNPERSRIDPDISGVWAWEADGDAGELYLFRPYDKRTWLVVGAAVEAGPEYEGAPLEIDSADDTFRILRSHEVGKDGITSTGTVAYKAWLTRLGGKHFMTWEAVGGFNSDGSHVPEYWFVWRLDKRDRDRFDLYLVNGEHDAFADLAESMGAFTTEHEFADADEYLRYLQKIRPKWDRALKKAAARDDDELYGDAASFTRVPDELMGAASELFEEVIDYD